jgi:type VI secretion system protein ImpM
MPCGLFGKLPAKRDFIAYGAPRRFLDVWEPWMQASMATSRQTMGEPWQDAFRSAPIWRFWLGAGVGGNAVLGAFMPSVDGVGRYFPLTAFAVDDDGAGFPPPEIEPNDSWFEGVEGLLLDALQQGVTYEAVTSAAASLADPIALAQNAMPTGMDLLPGGGVLVRHYQEALPVVLRAARRANHRHSCAALSCWWTVGGEGYAPAALLETGMPPPGRFASMLTGSFDAQPAS